MGRGIYKTDRGEIIKAVAQSKWNKGKNLLEELWKLKGSSQLLSFKQLEEIRGFLCHFSMVFEMITPYIKRFHLKLAKRLRQCDESRWKFSKT